MVPILVLVPLVAVASMPDAFDSRTQWPECTSPVRDSGDRQSGGCASEWAMTAAQTLQTNLCVLGKQAPVLSAAEVGSCNPKVANLLCTNWITDTAWYYVDQFGLHEEDCLPYTGRCVSPGICQDCRNASEAGCCTNASAASDVHKCPVPSSTWNGDDGLKQAIVQGGATQVTITMMADLWSYTGGIYNPMPGPPERAELAIKLVGWGREDGEFYWIAENTWGPNWGENGYFRVTNNAGSHFIQMSDGRACIDNRTALI